MIDAAGLIQGLRALLDGCSVVEGLDRAVEHRSNTSRREAAVEAIDKVVQRVDDAYRRLALISYLTGAFLVHSQANAMGASSIGVVLDANIRLGLDAQGDSWVNKIDSGGDRYTYYGEFGERVARLREGILRGHLDPILVLGPTLILHGISGLRGELLPAIGWDPLKGETYTRFANHPDLKTARMFERVHEKILRNKEKSDKIFEMFNKALPQVANNPYANAIVTNDYKVYPATHPPEDSSKPDNIPVAEPVSEAERGLRKQGTLAEPDRVKEIELEKGRLAKPDTETGIIPDPIGIVEFNLYDKAASDMGLEKGTRGVLVIGVLPNSIAEKAGLRAGTTPTSFDGINGMLGGDIIIGVEDNAINTKEELKHYLSQYHVQGTKIKFKVLRNGKPIDIELVY
jgi:hypothetical protein